MSRTRFRQLWGWSSAYYVEERNRERRVGKVIRWFGITATATAIIVYAILWSIS